MVRIDERAVQHVKASGFPFLFKASLLDHSATSFVALGMADGQPVGSESPEGIPRA